MRKIPEYITPEGFVCPECGQPCKIIALRNEFDYAGHYVTHGLPGTHYPDNWGDPVTDCCGAPVEWEWCMGDD
jgi:hypothetical protein